VSEDKVSINRQEIVTVDGLHYKQDHKLLGIDYDRDYEDIDYFGSYRSDRIYPLPTVKYKWTPTDLSTHQGVWAECGRCGSQDVIYVTRNMKDAIKAGFLKLVAPLKR